MIITKITTRKYDLYVCAKWQMTVGNTIAGRKRLHMSTKGLDHCFACNKTFDYKDYPYLAFVKNHRNVFVCEDCAKKILEENQVTAKFGNVKDVRHYKYGNGHWWHGPGIVDKYVIAWRENPEPYRPERSDNHDGE